ncbi:MAG: ATP-binding cassette domain-containing protein [Spirochaetaceae bacterium]|jgi:ATPase subunit of ABC transporter with duplicated ATPase domains|nr:ATP-binding cassette domain-containing protein [Spirochaetaceae bacterium]
MITITNLSFSYDSRPVFSQVSLSFSPGWTALVGPNGCGKSTLLRLIAGTLQLDSGIIAVPSLVLCRQDMETMPSCFSDPDIVNNTEFFSLVSQLEIKEEWAERWDTLSGGEKKRCIIADVLIRKPEVLLLDEPANHIDAYTIGLLTRRLTDFAGVGIAVSHNMSFLDALCRSTVILMPSAQGTGAVCINAPPGAALCEFDKEQRFLRKQKGALQDAVSTLSKKQKDAVRTAEQEKRKKLSGRNAHPHDSDSRAKRNLAVLSGRDKTGGKKVAHLKTALTQKEQELKELVVNGERKIGAHLKGLRQERKILYTESAGTMVLAGGIRLVHPDLTITHDARIVLTGNNGVGKSSLVERIVSDLDLPAPSVWYLHQELSFEELRSAQAQLSALNETDRGAVLSVVYRLGSEPEALLATQALSPGEARKVLFAFALLKQVSFIILDEPTNHLDSIAAASLADAIQEFAGAVLLVTHDRFFAEKTGRTFWHIEDAGAKKRLSVLA